MMQIYFLSIVLNVLAGLVLLSRKPSEVHSESDNKKRPLQSANEALSENEFFQNKSVCLITGILSLLVGVIKFFCVAKGGLIILGDLIPAVMGITAGFAILLNYYLTTATTEVNLPSVLKLIFVDNIYWLGIAAFAVAALHFVAPGVLFI